MDNQVDNFLRQKRQSEARDARLAQLEAQNAELTRRVTDLDQRAQGLAVQAQAAMRQTHDLNKALKKHHEETVRAFSNLVALRDGVAQGHARRVAEGCHDLALQLELSDEEAQDLAVAGLLLQVGKVVLPENVLATAYTALEWKDLKTFQGHAVVGAAVLSTVESLQNVARIVGQQYECYDGSGMPNGLIGERISLGARILAVVRDYDLCLEGKIDGHRMTESQAQAFVEGHRSARYDPAISDLFLKR